MKSLPDIAHLLTQTLRIFLLDSFTKVPTDRYVTTDGRVLDKLHQLLGRISHTTSTRDSAKTDLANAVFGMLFQRLVGHVLVFR